MSYSQAKSSSSSSSNNEPLQKSQALVITREMAIHWAIVLALALAVVVTTIVLLLKCKRYWGHKWHKWREGGRKKRDQEQDEEDEELMMRSPRMQRHYKK